MSNKLPVLFSLTGTDTPLDLSVKKPEMDPSVNTECPTFSTKSPVRASSLPQHLDYVPNDTEQRSVFGENLYSDHHSFYSLASASNIDDKRSLSSPIFLSNREEQYADQKRPSISPNFEPESGILPKKRKNLWRPYDHQARMEDMDKDSDSSDSNLSSDHEFRVPLTPPPPADPIKKRKYDMLRFVENQDPDMMRAHSPEDHMTFTKDDVIEHEGSSYVSSESDPSGSGINQALSKAQMSLMNNFPESREKMISGMKKRDIFGWSLKLSSPTESEETVAMKDTENCPDTVCKDGEKTYFELQTVRKSPPGDGAVDRPQNDTKKAESSKLTKVSPRSPRSPMSQRQDSSPSNDSSLVSNHNSQIVKDMPTKESENLVGKKVFIHGKDNTIESFDEAKTVSNKKSDTCKGLSLIDLIEEIEADALKEDKAKTEKERQIKNRRVAALLKQCNHVKLTALDFLMSNVLIEDNEQKRNTKNANIQKMLNGDKINSVSLLDVMEMQVEVGLS